MDKMKTQIVALIAIIVILAGFMLVAYGSKIDETLNPDDNSQNPDDQYPYTPPENPETPDNSRYTPDLPPYEPDYGSNPDYGNEYPPKSLDIFGVQVNRIQIAGVFLVLIGVVVLAIGGKR
jgi:uncharacterized membrane protein